MILIQNYTDIFLGNYYDTWFIDKLGRWGKYEHGTLHYHACHMHINTQSYSFSNTMQTLLSRRQFYRTELAKFG
jgi:hypothetical protein